MIQDFSKLAGRYYHVKYPTFSKRIHQDQLNMSPYLILAQMLVKGGTKLNENEPTPFSTGNAKEDRSFSILTACGSPIVPVVEAVFGGFPFDMALKIDKHSRGVGPKGDAGLTLTVNAPLLVQAIYEAFYRGLLGPITSPNQFVPDILARPNISGPGPIFIVGFARTGTSLLQFLLSLDTKHNRAPKNWEFNYPGSMLSRKERVEWAQPSNKDHGRWREVQPDHPAEDNVLFKLAGAMGTNPQDNEAQDWTSWNLRHRDHVALFCLHRMLVRQLEAQTQQQQHDDVEQGATSKQWIFKDPAHLALHMEVIVKVYPNARFIWTHRNMTDTVASYYRTTPDLLDNPPFKDYPKVFVASMLSAQRQGMAFRQTGRYLEKDIHTAIGPKCYNTTPLGSQEHRFHDIFLEDLLVDPVGELKKVYAKWNMPFSDEYEHSVLDWFANSGEKREPIASDTKMPPGFEDMNAVGAMMRLNRDYLRRFKRACPKGIVIVDRDENGVESGLLGNI